MPPNEPAPLEVVAVTPENADTTSLFFRGPDMERFKDRKPGQFASIRIMRYDEAGNELGFSEPHPFTLSCAPHEDTLRMTIKAVGAFTKAIPALKPGTKIQCSAPYGLFCTDIEAHSEVALIAGGVGITPFLSVLRHFRAVKSRAKVLLFWSNKTPADAFAAEELAAMTRELDLTVVHAFSRAEASGFAASGRVFAESGRITGAMLRKYGVRANTAVYLCGPPAMQEAMLAELSACGVEPGTVRKEAFSFKKP
jgi:ferredoxin-NADP reductase